MKRCVRCAVLVCVLVMAWITPALAVDSFFDIFYPVVSGPPYPTTGIPVSVGHFVGGALQVDGSETVALNAAHNSATLQDLPVDFGGSDGSPAQGNYSVDSFFDVTSVDTLDNSFSVDSFFDITYSLYDTGGLPGKLVVRNPQYAAGDPRRFFDVFFVDSFFDITYTIEFAPGVQHVIAKHGTVPTGLRLTNVSVNHTGSASNCGCDSFFDIFVDVQITQTPVTNPGVLSIHQTGTYVDFPVPVQSTTWGGVKNLYR